MTMIVHISDTHFGTEVPPVMAAITRAIADLRPDIIMLSGDVTQRARPGQFEAAARFMDTLPQNSVKLVIPGNHDIPLFNSFARFLSPYRHYEKAFGRRENLWCTDEIAVLCYDATSPLRHTRGKLPHDRTCRLLEEAKKKMNPNALLIACAHQPLVTAWPEDAHETLIGRGETAALWSAQGVDLALSGHVHVPLLTTTHAAFPDLPRHFILAGAGTAISHRVRPGAPNSFNAIKAEAQDGTKAVTITPYTFEAKSTAFTAGTEMKFTQTEQGWR